MKNVLHSLLAVVTVLFMAACSEDQLSNERGNEVNVTFTTNLAGAIQSKAFGDGLTVDELIFKVFKKGTNGEYSAIAALEQTVSVSGKQATVNVQLAKGETYSFLFWAQKSGKNFYTVGEDGSISVTYGTGANDEDRDAFYAVIDQKAVDGAFSMDVTLRRPFAQINLGTEDKEKAVAAGVTLAELNSAITVKDIPTKLNAFTGEVGEKQDVTFTPAAIPALSGETLTVKEKEYYYLGMNYILVESEKALVDATVTIKGPEKDITLELPGLPVQRNYRTNVLGNLLTANGNFNIIVDEQFNQEDHVYSQLLLAFANGGEVTLTEDVTLTEPLVVAEGKEVVLNLNGKTITSPSEARDADGNRIHVIVNNGNLTIKGGTVKSAANNGGSAIYNAAGATLVIDETVTVLGAPKADGNFPSYAINNYGNLTVNGTTVKSYHGGIATNNNGVTVINNAKVDVGQSTATGITSYTLYTSGAAKLTVNGGTFANTATDATNTGGAIICEGGDNSIEINGGNFSGGCGLYGDFVISGGTFDRDVTQWVASGYSAIKNTDGTYSIYGIDAASRTITINSVSELLKINDLNTNWVGLFSNGQGTDYSNYAEANGGKGVDFYYKWGWTIKLNANIDLDNITLDAPINLDGWGTFDGQNHVIKNVKIVTSTTEQTAAGLFTSSSCAIKNLKIDNIHVTGSFVGNSTAGILASDNNAGVSNITITNSSVTGGKYTGGVVGYGYADVTNCSLTNCVVKGGYKLGGVIGYVCANSAEQLRSVDGHTLTNCTVNGADGQYAGGKDKYIIGKIVGNYNANGSCENNTIVNMTTVATSDIGEIENGFSVEGTRVYVSSNESLAAVLNAGATTVVLDAGTYDIHKLDVDNREITIIGTDKANTILEMESTGFYPEGSRVKLQNLTISIGQLAYGAENTYGAMFRTTSLDIEDCNISGCLCLCGYGTTNIINCTFTNTNSSGFNGYGIFYYGYSGTTVNVKGCTFDMTTKAIVIYNHSTAAHTIEYNLNVENCTFKASDTTTDKAAIQMHTEQGSIYGTVKIKNSTATGFKNVNGGLWNEVNNNTQAVTDYFDIYVDGTQVH